MVELSRLREVQAGVVSRRQLLALGARKHDLDRLVRRRELTRVHPGVYVDHTGPLSWLQRAWAAVLYAGPDSALCLESALPSATADDPIHVAIEAERRVHDLPGVRVHRVSDLTAQVQWNLSPPRVRLEETVLELAHRAPTRIAVIGLLTEAVNSRRTTAGRIRAALLNRPRTRWRRWILRLLADLELGTCSVLEHGYLTRVERPHGLPRPTRQRTRRSDRGNEYRDVEHDEFALVVELDGRTGHVGWTASGRDADRDLDDLAGERLVVRLRWHQVFDRPCRTAHRLGTILQQRGWTGRLRRCGPGCQA